MGYLREASRGKPDFPFRGGWGIMGAPQNWGKVLEKGSNDGGYYFHWCQGRQKENFASVGLHKKGDACMSTTCCWSNTMYGSPWYMHQPAGLPK